MTRVKSSTEGTFVSKSVKARESNNFGVGKNGVCVELILVDNLKQMFIKIIL